MLLRLNTEAHIGSSVGKKSSSHGNTDYAGGLRFWETRIDLTRHFGMSGFATGQIFFLEETAPPVMVIFYLFLPLFNWYL
jgi:hypothetical protein